MAGDLKLRLRLEGDAAGVSSAVQKTSNDLDRLGQATRRAASESERLNRESKNLATSFSGLRAGAAALAAALSVREIVATNREFERLNAQLKAVTGSTQAAQKAFEQIQDFAARTPYDLNQVVEAFVKLKSLGLDPSIAALESYGNTASAMGKDLTQLIEAVADASVGEFERLKEFGIRAKKQGDEVALTFRNTTTVVKNNSEDIQNYLRQIGEVDFAGAMADQLNTLGGVFSNFKDELDKLFVAIGESFLNNVAKAIVRFATAMVREVSALVRQMTADIQSIWSFLTATLDIPLAAADDAARGMRALREEEVKLDEQMRGLVATAQENTAAYDELSAKHTAIQRQIISLGGELKEVTRINIEHGQVLKREVTPSLGGFAKAAGAAKSPVKELRVEVDTFDRTLQGLLEQIDPSIRESREFAEAIDVLTTALARGVISVEEHAALIGRLTTVTEEAKDATVAAADETATQWEESAKRIDSLFADLWSNVFGGAQDLVGSMKDLLLRFLAEMAHAFLTRPLMLQIQTMMGGPQAIGGAQSIAGALSGGFGQRGIPFGNLLGLTGGFNPLEVLPWQSGAFGMTGMPSLGQFGLVAGLGSLFGGLFGGKYGSIGGGLGATAGYGIGSTIGGLAGPIGAIAGAVIGTVLSSLFGDKSKDTEWFRYTSGAGVSRFPQLASGIGPFGAFGILSQNDIAGDRARETEVAQGVVQAVLQIDQALAAYLSGPAVAKVKAALSEPGFTQTIGFGEKPGTTAAEAVNALVRERIESVLGTVNERLLAVFQNLSQGIGDAEGMAQLAAGILAVNQQMEGLDAVITDLGRTSLERFNAGLDALSQSVADASSAFDAALTTLDPASIAQASAALQQAIVARYEQEMALVQQLAQAIYAINLQQANFTASIQQKMGVSSASTYFGAGVNILNAYPQAAGNPALQLQMVNDFVAAVDGWLAASISDVQAAAAIQQTNIADQIAALNEQKGLIQESYGAQIAALQEQLQLAQQWQGILDQVRALLNSMRLTRANPAPTTARLGISSGMISELQAQLASATGEERQRIVQRLIELYSSQLELAQEAFQRPSPEYMAVYNGIISQLTSLEAEAQSEAERALAIQARIEGLTAQMNASLASVDGRIASLTEQSAVLQTEANAQIEALKAQANEYYRIALEEGNRLYEQMRADAAAQLNALLGGLSIQEFQAMKQQEMVAGLTQVRDQLSYWLDAQTRVAVASDEKLAAVVSSSERAARYLEQIGLSVGAKAVNDIYGPFTVPQAQEGMWNTGQGGLVMTHPGEMILPRRQAEQVRSGGGEGGVSVVVNIGSVHGPVDGKQLGRTIRDELFRVGPELKRRLRTW